MTAINTNNQIVKFDYPIKDLQENVQLKQKELSHELDSTPLKREIYYGKNEVVAREPLKLDKESIVGLQEKRQKENVSENDFKTIRYEKKSSFKKYNICTYIDFLPKSWNKDNEFFLQKFAKSFTTSSCTKVDVSRTGVFFSYPTDLEAAKKLATISMVFSENENNVLLTTVSYVWNTDDEYEDESLSLNSSKTASENKIEENTFSSSSSHFLDEYLKQKDISNQFLIHQLIDNKLLKNLNLIV